MRLSFPKFSVSFRFLLFEFPPPPSSPPDFESVAFLPSGNDELSEGIESASHLVPTAIYRITASLS